MRSLWFCDRFRMMMVYFVTNPFLAVRTNLVLSCATLLGYLAIFLIFFPTFLDKLLLAHCLQVLYTGLDGLRLAELDVHGLALLPLLLPALGLGVPAALLHVLCATLVPYDWFTLFCPRGFTMRMLDILPDNLTLV